MEIFIIFQALFVHEIFCTLEKILSHMICMYIYARTYSNVKEQGLSNVCFMESIVICLLVSNLNNAFDVFRD